MGASIQTSRTAEQCFIDEVEGAVESAALNGVPFIQMRLHFQEIMERIERDAAWEAREVRGYPGQ